MKLPNTLLLQLFLLTIPLSYVQSQLIFPESFVVLLDSTQRFRGSFTPEVKIQTQRETLVEITSITDVAFRVKGSSVVLAQKTEFTAFGDETALSGGYLYGKLRNRKDGHLMPEYFGQLQYADARGLNLKYAVGANLRYALRRRIGSGIFIGAGPFYEWERWNYRGVREELRPVDQSPVISEGLRFQVYGSWKQRFGEKYVLDVSVYHQSAFDEIFTSPRLGSSTALSWQISRYLRFGGRYQNIYDPEPVVPIRRWFHRFIMAFSVTL